MKSRAPGASDVIVISATLFKTVLLVREALYGSLRVIVRQVHHQMNKKDNRNLVTSVLILHARIRAWQTLDNNSPYIYYMTTKRDKRNPMSIEENKTLVQRIYELLNRKEFDASYKYFAPEFVFHSPDGDWF